MIFLPEALWFNEYHLNHKALQPVGHDRSSLLRRSSHFGYEGWKLQGISPHYS